MNEKKKADAEKIIRTLYEVWADQYGCSVEVTIEKKGKKDAT